MIYGKIHHCEPNLPEPTEAMLDEEQVHRCRRCGQNWVVFRYPKDVGLFARTTYGYDWEPYNGHVDPIGKIISYGNAE